MKGEREACLEAGMDDFVTKPVNFAELLRSIDRLAGGASVTAARTAGARNGEAENGDDIFGEAHLLDIVQGDRQLAIELANIFLGELEPRMDEIAESIRSGDARRLESAAHALKGSALSVSAKGVADSALSLELLGRSGKVEGADALLTELTSAATKLRASLSAFAESV
jgi:HPt (histidine-containing phosphotransfer) domain-containing protein